MQDRLTIDRPTPLGRALARAVHDVCARPPAIELDDLGLLDAHLAAGDFEGVLARLRDAAPAAALPLFLARYVRWSGDLQSAAALWDRVSVSLDGALSADIDPALRHASCLELAATATDLGDAQLAARLHGIARGIAPGSPLPPPADPQVRLVCDIAFATIGIEADAARGRLRLRPRLDRMTELHVRHIRFGDASVSLLADREGDALIIRVEQDTGSIPVTVLLEPFVLLPSAATVDGQPADLAPQEANPRSADARSADTQSADPQSAENRARGSDSGTIVPVQLVLDDTRTLVIRTRAGGCP